VALALWRLAPAALFSSPRQQRRGSRTRSSWGIYRKPLGVVVFAARPFLHARFYTRAEGVKGGWLAPLSSRRRSALNPASHPRRKKTNGGFELQIKRRRSSYARVTACTRTFTTAVPPCLPLLASSSPSAPVPHPRKSVSFCPRAQATPTTKRSLSCSTFLREIRP